jgi:hypothetical protein
MRLTRAIIMPEGRVMAKPKPSTNLRSTEILVPQSNTWSPAISAVPERFRSVSAPVGMPVVNRELNSTSSTEPPETPD